MQRNMPSNPTNNIPAFLGKLWKMVEDPNTDHLISWSESGNTFIIHEQPDFWFKLLPLYYKHNNMSSFVRQLNMYGFHKISSLENPGMTAIANDDVNNNQFYNPYFRRDKPEDLARIRRKGPPSKAYDIQGVVRHDDLSKVLTDVKQLRGRQSGVNAQLSAMKQENAVLWRELAILRQKHTKQQQIVNKLIQFLVTLVQPAASPRMGVGAKRRMPLMLHESPSKKSRVKKNGGPTIHELEPELSPQQLLEDVVGEEDMPLIDSPVTPNSQTSQGSPLPQQVALPITSIQNIQNDGTAIRQQRPVNNDSEIWSKPEYVTLEDINDDISDNQAVLMETLQKNAGTTEEVFLNPKNRDALIGSLTNSGNYNISTGGKNVGNTRKPLSNNKKIASAAPPPNMQIATKNSKITSGEDLDLHLDNTQNELDQLKDILNGCSTFDANSLLGLFADNENEPDYGIRSTLQNKENPEGQVSGNEVASPTNLIDFNELFNDDLNNQDDTLAVEAAAALNNSAVVRPQSSSLNTPVIIIKDEPIFPNSSR